MARCISHAAQFRAPRRDDVYYLCTSFTVLATCLHVERTAAIHIVGEEDVGQPLRCGTGAVAQLQELAEPNGASAVRIEREEELLHL